MSLPLLFPCIPFRYRLLPLFLSLNVNFAFRKRASRTLCKLYSRSSLQEQTESEALPFIKRGRKAELYGWNARKFAHPLGRGGERGLGQNANVETSLGSLSIQSPSPRMWTSTPVSPSTTWRSTYSTTIIPPTSLFLSIPVSISLISLPIPTLYISAALRRCPCCRWCWRCCRSEIDWTSWIRLTNLSLFGFRSQFL